MKYFSVENLKVGDIVSINIKYKGTIIANIDNDDYSDHFPKAKWVYLKSGILIDTDFGGLVHYDKELLITDKVKLL